MKKIKRFSVLLLVLLIFSCSSLAKPGDVVYLIPEGFTGGVIVLYNQSDGIVPETTKDGTTLYHIPKDGFLKIKFPFDNKARKFKFYYIDNKDERTEIEYLYSESYVRNPGDTTSKSEDRITEDEQNNRIFVIDHRTISFDNNGSKVMLKAFSVGHPKDSRSMYIDTDFKIGEIGRKL